MQKSLMPLAAFAAAAGLCLAGSTRTWLESDFADFEKGDIKNLSIRSDGRLMLAPKLTELFDSSSAYLWAVAQDSKGNLYTGGGPGAKLYRVSGNSSQKLAEFDALEIHAIAIDKEDRVYAATAPDGKIFRVTADGKSQQFYDPKQKYIWAMAFDGEGNLYVATGDKGEVHRVTPDGKGSLFFKSDETHVRSLVIDSKDNLILGTEPGGLVMRISPRGEGFVLYQMGKREITAVGLGADGSVYAAGSGIKQPATAPAAPVAPQPVAPPAAASAATARIAAVEPPPSFNMSGPRSSAASGGSDLYRIHPSGYPEKLWTSAQDVVYALAFDAGDLPLLGTGNKGALYRVDTPARYTLLLNVPVNQITGMIRAKNGAIEAITGNVGKVYRIGPALEQQGTIESEAFDSGNFSLWGRLMFEGETNGGRISVVTRTGNVDRPQKNWSSWSPSIDAKTGTRIASPGARFLQWKATLASSPSGGSPYLDSVETAYLTQNVAPRVELVEITPANYRFAPPAVTINAPANPTINLPPIGKRTPGTSLALDLSASSSMQYAKGWIGARWTASDDNGDQLLYSVEIRGEKEKDWKLLKDKLREKQFTFDSTAFPDGEYRIRVSASDSPSNPKDEALTAQLESNPLLIDNTPPRIGGLSAARDGGGIHLRWKAIDSLSVLKRAEYSVDGGDWTIVNPVTKLSDSLALDYDVTIPGVAAGEHTVAVRVTDDYDNADVEKVVLGR